MGLYTQVLLFKADLTNDQSDASVNPHAGCVFRVFHAREHHLLTTGSRLDCGVDNGDYSGWHGARSVPATGTAVGRRMWLER